MSFLRQLRAAFLFARHQAWVDQPVWEKADAETMGRFLASPTGVRLKDTLVNLVLRQQAASLSKTSGLEYEAGYCTGQKAMVAVLESMADLKQFTHEGELEDADHHAN